ENGGRIIAISSAASLSRPAGLAAYNASKAALNAYIETLAKDLKGRAITANVLVPTSLDTDANRKEMPEQRLVKRTNVAEMIALLLSDQASAVTGQLIGMSA
ncbi:MAG TPA: SDR family oxidoreductase, partial [Thermoanaerobaculia bacterium]|nr:SDR family oxidoreductase [Thermoanaerobaculia bacterium]